MYPANATPHPSTTCHVPEYFHLAETNDILQLVVDMFNRLIIHNDAIPVTPNNLTRFHSRASPNISINDYLRRIVKYASVEKSVLLLLLIYIDRICERSKLFTISSLTAHRFIITAVTVGSKTISDIYPTNTHFAKVGGISVVELNLLEVEMCTTINWRLAVTVEVLQQYYVNLVRTSMTQAAYPNSHQYRIIKKHRYPRHQMGYYCIHQYRYHRLYSTSPIKRSDM
ncbi:hypothetical protein SeMB42_g06848 [Synchytrium endobioticum]|uniref:Cyclin n=1 Tax=Synchytrium endobioticum TaxID=286115 RepID=A0A507CDZ5_9FUNG|nr:hypothetical protein SeMB42_g06848 [Synchytrium endobioticum]